MFQTTKIFLQAHIDAFFKKNSFFLESEISTFFFFFNTNNGFIFKKKCTLSDVHRLKTLFPIFIIIIIWVLLFETSFITFSFIFALIDNRKISCVTFF